MIRRHWFEGLADHLGSAYLRYSFTKGTEAEVDFLVGALGLGPGSRLLDVGCGPGRHAHAFGRRSVEVVGVDISERFVELARRGAPPGVTFVRADARALTYEGGFDAVISLCQGAFGLAGGPAAGGSPDPDGEILAGMARALRPGGRLALTAFSAYFQLLHLEPGNSFDAETGVHHEVAVVKDEEGSDAHHDLWTTCFTPRELRLLLAVAGLVTDGIWAVEPGDYARRPPDLAHPEFLALATRP
ncbi:MAG: class I SAM-dependent methyltransferase [Acidimicrobiia bacterium]